METGFTRGEWKLHDDVIETDYSPNGAIIAVANKATDKWRANARLIAVAPEMFKELSFIAEHIENASPEGLRIIKARISKVLAKAEGK